MAKALSRCSSLAYSLAAVLLFFKNALTWHEVERHPPYGLVQPRLQTVRKTAISEVWTPFSKLGLIKPAKQYAMRVCFLEDSGFEPLTSCLQSTRSTN